MTGDRRASSPAGGAAPSGSNGDESHDAALDDAMVAAYPSLLAYARLLTGSRARAEEVVHEALVRCLRRGRSAPIHNLAAYARRAVLNEVYRDARRRRREPLVAAMHEDDGPVTGPSEARRPRYGDGVEAVVDQQVLRAWLAHLPVRQRAAVVSRYYLDMTEQDTADLLGCSVSAVKSLCHRGIASLRESAGSGSDLAADSAVNGAVDIGQHSAGRQYSSARAATEEP